MPTARSISWIASAASETTPGGSRGRAEEPLAPWVVLGATATGKSRFAVALAEAIGGEIVNFDSSCVYRGLDIATAKPDAAARARVPHHLVDCCDPREEFSAARFVGLATQALGDIRARGRRAILVGGTGLYLRALLRGLVESPPPSASLRERLERRESARPGSLHRLLTRLDPATAARISRADSFRAVRALEHRLATGRQLSADQLQWSAPERLRVRKLGLVMPRPEREAEIRRRIDSMLLSGLLDEVRGLLASGVPREARSLRALGYAQAIEHLEGRMTLDEVRIRILFATRQYAKRQDTWFRREPGVEWSRAPRDEDQLCALVRGVIIGASPEGARGG